MRRQKAVDLVEDDERFRLLPPASRGALGGYRETTTIRNTSGVGKGVSSRRKIDGKWTAAGRAERRRPH